MTIPAIPYFPRQPSVAHIPGPSGFRTWYLLDEIHDCEEGIEQNIDIARALVRDASVHIIGIEGVPGQPDEYPEPPGFFVNMPSIPRSPRRFERAMRESAFTVVGIDSDGWNSRIHSDIHGFMPNELGHHFGQFERSLHFVRAMVRHATVIPADANVLICCGAAHSGHIFSIATSPIGQPPAWPQATFVRLRAPAFLTDHSGAT